MKLEQQVCSLDFALKLRDLDVEQYSLWQWCCIDGKWSIEWSQSDMPIKAERHASAFTVAELGNLLPICFVSYKHPHKHQWECSQEYTKVVHFSGTEEFPDIGGVVFFEDTEADSRAKMFLYLLENKFIKP